MSITKEFKEFAMKGNVVDMAVGIIIGAAFGKIVASFVANVVMPPLGLLIGGVDFTELKYILKPANDDVAAVAIEYGIFIQTVFDFAIVAFAIFMAIKAMNSLKQKEEAKPTQAAKIPEDIKLLREIRDSLQNSPANAMPKKAAAKKK